MTAAPAARNSRLEAIGQAMDAIRTAPGDLTHMDRFMDLAGGELVTAYSPAIDAAIEACLAHADKLSISKMERLWTSHLHLRPDFRARYVNTPISNTTVITDFRPVLTPYFLRGIRHIIACAPPFEKFIAHLRRHVLEDAALGTKHLSPGDHLALGAALAHYGFNCEYIIDYTTVQEKEAALRLQEKGARKPAEIVALACYMPLYKLENADEIEKRAGPALADVVSTQITGWRALKDKAARIESATPISKGVSEAVRTQYEEFPYPRWGRLSISTLKDSWEARLQEFPFLERACTGKFSGLVAGCGTGQEPVSYALSAPQADFTAVDLSRTSLAYAAMKAEEHGAHNIAFRHGDILKLEEMGRSFDFISCSGVLHHMENPLAGWRVLTNLLKPDGVMRISLYSKRARRHILAAQDAARNNGYTGERDSMIAFRRDCPRNLRPETMRALAGFLDYYVLSMYRDLLFHVQEKNYDLTEIEAMLDALGLKFEGFTIDAQAKRALKAMSLDPARLSDWHTFEQKYPDTFGYMYQFWCTKKT